MPKKRVSTTRSKATSLADSGQPSDFDLSPRLKVHRFAGVALGGGKTDKTTVAIVEYYPHHKKIFLRHLYERIRQDGSTSSDQLLVEILNKKETGLENIVFDAPSQLPKCLRCSLPCPGYESCNEKEIRWLWKTQSERKKKRPLRIFTPYTERCAEMYISTQLEEPFHPSHALGANMAPLTARSLFLRRRLSQACLEANPRVSLWRIGRALRVPKSYLRYYRHSIEGDESRLYVLRALVEKGVTFLYEQDIRSMVENWSAFEAFLCALTGFLYFRGQCEEPPAHFPEGESWIEFPKEHVEWF